MVKRIIYYFCSLFVSTAAVSAQQKTDLTVFVKPNIGSVHSRYFFYTPAAVPFGMAKLAPSTNGSYGNKSGWEAVGYDDRHTSIEGFANFHEFQVGGVVFAPSVGKLKTMPGQLDRPKSGYRSDFDKKDEFATSGYYRVMLKDYNILAELTATKRVGFHRYTFPKTEEANLIFDIGHVMGESGPVVDAEVNYDKQHVWGYVVTNPVYVQKYQQGATVKMFFFAEINKQPKSFGTFRDSITFDQHTRIKGKGAGVYLKFGTEAGESIDIKTGLSYTSVENAQLNLLKEAKDMSFDAAKNNALQTWNSELGRILVEGGKADDRIKFYTGLYHALLGRGLASDVNGAYPKNDGSVGQIALNKQGQPIHHHYNTDAIWGAFWNLTQLWSIAYPDYYNDWIQSQLLVYRDAGWLGDGIANSKYVSGVGTNFTGLAIAAAYNVGIRDYDMNLAYDAVRKNFRNYPMDGAICMIPRRSLCGQRIVLDDSFQTLTLMNHGVDFRKEMHGSIRSMFRMSHKNWLNSLERICSISGWIVSLRCRRRMCLEVVHKLTPSQGLKVFIITVINRTCISLGCSIFLVDLI